MVELHYEIFIIQEHLIVLRRLKLMKNLKRKSIIWRIFAFAVIGIVGFIGISAIYTTDIMKEIFATSYDVEEQVRSMFKGDKTSPENTEKIISLLPLINWTKYSEVNDEDFLNITKWLRSLKISNKDSMANLLNSTNGLDVLYKDIYSSTLKCMFFNNKETFVKALINLDKEQIKLIVSYIQSDCNENEAIEVIEYLIDVLVSNNLSVDEMLAAEHYFLGEFKIDLFGTLTNNELFYGPPNYGENPKTDKKSYPYMLKLDKPIKMGVVEIAKVQVVPSIKNIKSVNNFLNKHVKIEGTLFFALTGHHYTPILIEVDEVSKTK